MVILLSAIALCIDSYSLDRNRLFKYRVDAALSAKKAGRRQMSDGMKLGKGFGSPGSISEPEETNEKNVLNPMVYSEANNLIQGASSLDQTSPLTKPTNSAISDLPDADAVFKKYGIGKGQSDRFGNEVKQPTSTGSKRTLKPGETRAFGESVLERFSPSQLGKIDSILVTGSVGSLIVVVLLGIGISFGAVKVVFPNFAIDTNIDSIIENFLIPAFTPAVLLFFLSSITYGLFKYAQAQSVDTVYREE